MTRETKGGELRARPETRREEAGTAATEGAGTQEALMHPSTGDCRAIRFLTNIMVT